MDLPGVLLALGHSLEGLAATLFIAQVLAAVSTDINMGNSGFKGGDSPMGLEDISGLKPSPHVRIVYSSSSTKMSLLIHD